MLALALQVAACKASLKGCAFYRGASPLKNPPLRPRPTNDPTRTATIQETERHSFPAHPGQVRVAANRMCGWVCQAVPFISGGDSRHLAVK